MRVYFSYREARQTVLEEPNIRKYWDDSAVAQGVPVLIYEYPHGPECSPRSTLPPPKYAESNQIRTVGLNEQWHFAYHCYEKTEVYSTSEDSKGQRRAIIYPVWVPV